MENIDRFLEKNESIHLLKEFVSKKGISATGEGIDDSMRFVSQLLKSIGANVEIISTEGHPIIVGEIKGESDFCALMYGHYDVQDTGDYSRWKSDPFRVHIENGRMYGRGVGDNKGQLLAQLLGVKKYLDLNGKLPFTIKFVFEGEEELGSVHLEPFVSKYKNGLIASDIIITVDGSSHESGCPVLRLGTRGLLFVELKVKTAQTDNHSGNAGNVIENPMWKMISILNQLKDSDGTVNIPHYYDGVRDPDDTEIHYLKKIPFDKKKIAERFGVSSIKYDDPLEFYKQLMFRPTFNICGVRCGYQGTGAKTVLPGEASVYIDMRLVGEQDPSTIFMNLCKLLENYDGVSVERSWSASPSYSSVHSPFVAPILRALKSGFGKEPILEPVMPGTLPNYIWTKVAHKPTFVIPLANADQNNHAPNENLRIDQFFSGIKSIVYLIDEIGALNK